MGTERDKMLAGELYDALDPDLVSDRYRVRGLCQKLNASRDADEDLRRDLHDVGGPSEVPQGATQPGEAIAR